MQYCSMCKCLGLQSLNLSGAGQYPKQIGVFMMQKSVVPLVLLAALISVPQAQAEVKEYIRDYNYHGTDFDTADTGRINAIDGVRRELLNEIGSYVGSVIKTHQDSLGNSYMSQDLVNITAGIVALKVLNERWSRPVYFVKAGMKADPDDVLAKLQAMRADLELEKSLRSSYEALQSARAELEELKAQLAQLKKAGAAGVIAPPPLAAAQVVIPAPKPVTVQMQQMEDQAHKEARAVDEGSQLFAAGNVPVAAPSRDVVEAKPEILQEGAEKLQARYQKVGHNIESEEAFQRGLVAKIQGDFTALLREMAPLAEKGYSRAQVLMGLIHERGMGVEQDYLKALEWYEKAIVNGAKNAPAHIGRMYELGFGVKQDYAKAAEYYRRSINMGGSLGYARMGFLHETGKGVQFDRVKAVSYYEEAMARGDYHAMALLGLLYQHGRGGLDRDDKKAVELYKTAMDHGEPLAMTRMGEMYNQGIGGVHQDQQKAMALFLESARYKLPASYAHLGRMYEEGWATRQDYAEAKKWYEQAAEHDAIYAMRRLGFMYKEGLGMKRDWDKAAYWFKRAANLGDDKSQGVLRKRAYWR